MYPLRRAALAAVDELHREVSTGRSRPERLQDVLRGALRDPALQVGFRAPGSESYRDADGRPVPAGGVPVRQDDEPTGVLVPGSGPASPELLREVADRCSTLVEVVRLRSEVAQALRDVPVQPDPARRDRLRGAPPDGARPARRRSATAGLTGHAAATGPTPPRRRHRRRRRTARRERGRARERGGRAAADRARAAAEQPRRRAAGRVVEPGPQPADDRRHGRRRQSAARRRGDHGVLRRQRGDRQRGQACRGDPDRAPRRTPRRSACWCGSRDDGCGGARLGLRSGLADRVAALGGSLSVASPVGRGTEVEAALPCAS